MVGLAGECLPLDVPLIPVAVLSVTSVGAAGWNPVAEEECLWASQLTRAVIESLPVTNPAAFPESSTSELTLPDTVQGQGGCCLSATEVRLGRQERTQCRF